MIIDNLEFITPLLEFNSKDEFYFLSLIQRKKDIPTIQGRNNSSRCIKNYYITSQEYLRSKYDEIKSLCNITKARACINLNKKSFRNVGLETLGLISTYIQSGDYNNIKRAWDSSCGNAKTIGDKRWIVDIDKKSINYCSDINSIITKIEPIGDKLISVIETKNGYHLITKPFNRKIFGDKNLGIDIQTHNPTILYIPEI